MKTVKIHIHFHTENKEDEINDLSEDKINR